MLVGKIIVQLQTAHKNAGFKFELQGFNDHVPIPLDNATM